MSPAPLILTIITFFSTLAGGLFAIRYLGKHRSIAAFAAGVLIAVPLFDLLPEAQRLAMDTGIPLIHPLYILALGFIFLLILERYLSVSRVCEAGACRNLRHQRGGWIGATELSVHSYLDGFAIGVGFQVNAQAGLLVAAAVIFHDFSDGLNTVTLMLRAGNSMRSTLEMLLLDATTPLLGAATTLFLTFPESALVYLLPFFAGGFLYLGASDLLPEAHENNPPVQAIAATLAGFAMIFIVVNLVT